MLYKAIELWKVPEAKSKRRNPRAPSHAEPMLTRRKAKQQAMVQSFHEDPVAYIRNNEVRSLVEPELADEEQQEKPSNKTF